jgi:hypothetical protein
VLDGSDTDDDTSDEEAEIAKVATVAKVTKVDSSDKETVVGPSAVRTVDHVDETDVNVKETGSIASETPKSKPAPAPMYAPKPTPPHLKLDKVAIDVANYDTPPDGAQTPPSVQTTPSPQLNKPLPKSPGQTSPFAALFSWAAPSPSATEFSSISSPISPGRNGGANDTPYSTVSISNDTIVKGGLMVTI